MPATTTNGLDSMIDLCDRSILPFYVGQSLPVECRRLIFSGCVGLLIDIFVIIPQSEHTIDIENWLIKFHWICQNPIVDSFL